MNALSNAIKDLAREIREARELDPRTSLSAGNSGERIVTSKTVLIASELLYALGRLFDGADVYRAFGAPGDWGHGTPIGEALSTIYQTPGGGAGHQLIELTSAEKSLIELLRRTRPAASDIRAEINVASLAGALDCDWDSHNGRWLRERRILVAKGGAQ